MRVIQPAIKDLQSWGFLRPRRPGAFKAIAEAGIIPGIKVDTGAKDMAGHPRERITEGLDGLRHRLKEYLEMGARFAKWRAVRTFEVTVNGFQPAYAQLVMLKGMILKPNMVLPGLTSPKQEPVGRIQCRDGEDMRITTRISGLTRSAA